MILVSGHTSKSSARLHPWRASAHPFCARLCWCGSCTPCPASPSTAFACAPARSSMVRLATNAELHGLLVIDAAPCSMSGWKSAQAPDLVHCRRLLDGPIVRREAAPDVRRRHPRRSQPAMPALLPSHRGFDTLLSSCDAALRGRANRYQPQIRRSGARIDGSDEPRDADWRCMLDQRCCNEYNPCNVAAAMVQQW